MIEDDLTSFYQEGFAAFAKHKPIECPYKPLSDNGAAWHRGFNTARYGELLGKKAIAIADGYSATEAEE